jgi:galactose mutarotase-like enzyme
MAPAAAGAYSHGHGIGALPRPHPQPLDRRRVDVSRSSGTGARLLNWNVSLPDGTIRDVIYWPELSSLDDVGRVRGGNPILFPFNARTFHQGAIHQWKDPEGRVRPMPMHGIARQGRFKVSHHHELGFTAVLEPDEAAREAYPFAYEFSVTYRFSPTRLTCELSLENHDREPIPWSAGHHFYFTVPWKRV